MTKSSNRDFKSSFTSQLNRAAKNRVHLVTGNSPGDIHLCQLKRKAAPGGLKHVFACQIKILEYFEAHSNQTSAKWILMWKMNRATHTRRVLNNSEPAKFRRR